MGCIKDVVEEEAVRELEDSLAGVPLAMRIVYGLEGKYDGRIPLDVAQSVLANTRGVLQHGWSTDFVLIQLKRYGVIAIEEGYVF